MERWTIKQLSEIDDVSFTIAMLNERANDLKNPYSPLSKKIRKAVATLTTMQSYIKQVEEDVRLFGKCCCTCARRYECDSTVEYKHNFQCWKKREYEEDPLNGHESYHTPAD